MSAPKVVNGSGPARKVVNGSGTPHLPEFSRERFPDLQRGNFSTPSQQDREFFENLLGPDGVLSDPAAITAHNVDWDKQVRGESNLVLFPRTTQDVSAIIKYCNDRNLALCPQGGNTGLVWGSVPVFDEIIVNTKRMNDIISFDETSGVLVCQAGCILGTIDDYVRERGFVIPLDLGARKMCHIGGNVATNAGGIRALRYGSMHANVLGLEVVLPNGDVLESMNTLRKDNSGYHVKHMFIGSEGTLGIITKVVIMCPAAPTSVNVLFLGTDTFQSVIEIYKEARKRLSEILSACEMMDSECMDLVRTKLGMTNPVAECSFYVVIETSGSNVDHDTEKAKSFLEFTKKTKLAIAGVIGTDAEERTRIWELRLRVGKALWAEGCMYTFDVSLPLDCYYDAVVALARKLREDKKVVKRVCGFGHMGDSNLHLAVATAKFDPELLEYMEEYVYDWVSERQGSIAAEHGVGFKKTRFLSLSKSRQAIDIMQAVKNQIDPRNLMNPYKVLPIGLKGKYC